MGGFRIKVRTSRPKNIFYCLEISRAAQRKAKTRANAQGNCLLCARSNNVHKKTQVMRVVLERIVSLACINYLK
jgi:hypothetical protein